MPLPIFGSFDCSFLSFNIVLQDLANKSVLRRSTATSLIANFSSLIDRWNKCCSKCVPKLHCLSPLSGSKSMGSDIPSLPTDDQEMEHSPLGMDFPCRVRSGVSPQSKPLRLNKAYGKAAASDYEAHEIHLFSTGWQAPWLQKRQIQYSKCLNLGHFLCRCRQTSFRGCWTWSRLGFGIEMQIIGDNGNIKESWSCMADLQQKIGK